MDAFKDACEIERMAREELWPWLTLCCAYIKKTDRQYFIQEMWGDFIAGIKHHQGALGKYAKIINGLELKSERTDKHGNFFLEFFSNKRMGRAGWMLRSHATFLLYFFLNTGNLYLMHFDSLKEWAFFVDPKTHKMRITNYPLKQTKVEQLNDTWGYCVPKNDLTDKPFVKLITREERDKAKSGDIALTDMYQFFNDLFYDDSDF